MSLEDKLSGIWLSRYEYETSSKPGKQEAEHYVLVRRFGHELLIESLPHTNLSKMRVHLTVKNSIATGTWEEHQPKAHEEKGAVYNGAAQLIIDPESLTMRGKWVGFSSNLHIKTGLWEFTRVGDRNFKPEKDL